MKIKVYDEYDPETTAMMQALYSRSAASVEEHVEKISKTGSKKFMESYYVGYGHASIGDCGTTTIFFEGFSMLAAKAIQDSQLYRGQETSTRYINFNEQPLVDPLNSPETHKMFMDFYNDSLPVVQEHLKELFPFDQDIGLHSVWKKTINARAFDIMRGFLPAGITTQLSWTTSLRDAYEHLYKLSFHPLKEVRDISENTLKALKEKYPASFSHKTYEELEEYYKDYYDDFEEFYSSEYYITDNEVHRAKLFSYTTTFEEQECPINRPKYSKLPKWFNFQNTDTTFDFFLDFGSFRDLQRHRGGHCQMPRLTTRCGFNEWYLEQLPYALREKAEELLKTFEEQHYLFLGSEGWIGDYEQYYVPMGYNIHCKLRYNLSQMVYVSELRSQTTVHPTLRKVAQKMAKVAKIIAPNVEMHVDFSEDSLDTKRGLQDIVKKG
jgi:thymidylate synthase ThyX